MKREADNFSTIRHANLKDLLSLLILTVLVIIMILLVPTANFAAEKSDKQLRKAKKELYDGNFVKAEEMFRELLQKDEKDIGARLGLSLLFLKQRNLQEAYNEANRVLAIDPQNARAHALNGTALLRSGYLYSSVEQLRAALTINIKDSLALASAAELDLYENRTQEAYEMLRYATSLDPDEPDHWLLFARAASRLERFREAASALRNFLQNAPKGDAERRSRIEGVIKFYTYLGDTHTYQINGSLTTIRLDIKRRRPYLMVKINGKGPLRFVLDTGAGVSVISAEAAEKLGIKEIARGGNARAVGGDGSFPIIYALLDQMELGGIKISNVPIYIRRIHQVSNSQPEEVADGYLGLAVLSNFLFTIDYKQGELKLEEFEKGDPKTPLVDLVALATPGNPPSTTLHFRTTESGLISVETKIDDGAVLNFIFDSGATSSIISSSVVDKQNWNDKVLNDVVRVVGAAGVTENIKLMLAGRLQLMDLVRENLRMPILNLNMINEHAGFEQQGILGGDFLQSCRIQVDFHRLQMTITSHNTGLVKRVNEASQVKVKEEP